MIDGAQALHKAVVEVFGAHALIQRCREHNKRNVTDALPERLRGSIRSAMNQVYAARVLSAPGTCSRVSPVVLNISIRAPLPRCARGWKKR